MLQYNDIQNKKTALFIISVFFLKTTPNVLMINIAGLLQ